MRLRYTAQARADLKAIQAYIARDAPHRARQFVKRLRTAVERLASFPQCGGIVEEWGREDVRELIIGNYRIIYRLKATEIVIRTVIHGARMLPDAPED